MKSIMINFIVCTFMFSESDVKLCLFYRIHSSIEEDDSLTKIHAKRKRQVDIPKSLIVYKIEGCIPSRYVCTHVYILHICQAFDN